MMGKCHVVSGEALFLGCSGAAVWVSHISEEQSLWFNWFPSSVTFGMLALVGVAFGTLLPDIDSSSSVLGRFVHLPLKHRTWTHSVWAILLLLFLNWCVASLWVSVAMRAVLFGYVTHLLLDGVSAAGICFWYPFQKYRMYPGGAFIKPGHKIKLYHAGSKMEIVLCVFISLLGFGFFLWTMVFCQGISFVSWL